MMADRFLPAAQTCDFRAGSAALSPPAAVGCSPDSLAGSVAPAVAPLASSPPQPSLARMLRSMPQTELFSAFAAATRAAPDAAPSPAASPQTTEVALAAQSLQTPRDSALLPAARPRDSPCWRAHPEPPAAQAARPLSSSPG